MKGAIAREQVTVLRRIVTSDSIIIAEQDSIIVKVRINNAYLREKNNALVSENKETKKIRESISAILGGGLEDFNRVMGELQTTNPVKFVETYIKLLEYSVPKLRAVESTVEFGSDTVSKIVVELKTRDGDNNPSNTGIPEELPIQ